MRKNNESPQVDDIFFYTLLQLIVRPTPIECDDRCNKTEKLDYHRTISPTGYRRKNSSVCAKSLIRRMFWRHRSAYPHTLQTYLRIGLFVHESNLLAGFQVRTISLTQASFLLEYVKLVDGEAFTILCIECIRCSDILCAKFSLTTAKRGTNQAAPQPNYIWILNGLEISLALIKMPFSDWRINNSSIWCGFLCFPFTSFSQRKP